MARVQLVIPDQDRDRFVQQARSEGMTFSAWLRAAAHDRLQERRRSRRSKGFETPEQWEEFFKKCDALEDGPDVEPDWEEHLRVINASRLSGSTGT